MRLRTLAAGAVVLAAVGTATLEDTAAHGVTHPRHCAEATLKPHGALATACRAEGWTLIRKLAVSPAGVLVGSGLPDCRTEDSNNNGKHCGWNLPGSDDGNRRGRSYWIDHRNGIHYVTVS